MRRIALSLLALATDCEGDPGPVGPQGPPGPEGPAGPQGTQGPAGPGTRITFTGTVVPNGLGQAELPVIACYLSSDGTAWFSVDYMAFNGPRCSVTGAEDGSFIVVVMDGLPEWCYFISVVY